MEDTQILEKVETSVVSRGGESFADLKEEVHRLLKQASDWPDEADGTKVINFLDLGEKLLMQVHKADRIRAEKGITIKRDIGRIIKNWQISAANGQYGRAHSTWKPKLEWK